MVNIEFGFRAALKLPEMLPFSHFSINSINSASSVISFADTGAFYNLKRIAPFVQSRIIPKV